MRYFPVFIDAEHIDALVVGAGEVASRKCELLMKTAANISVVAPDICSTVQSYADANHISVAKRKFCNGDLVGKNMVFVATDDPKVNQHVHDLAVASNVFVNVVDNTPLCKFITPSIVDRDPIVIAMSSGGVAPVLLRFLRQKLESVIPAKVSKLGKFSEKFRESVKSTFSSVTSRRYFWEDVLDGVIAENVLQGNEAKAEKLMQDKLATASEDYSAKGEVYLVGAGPGDPDLLTFRALRLMQKADVVVYDRLVSKEILELVRRDAEKIYVGKAKSKHTIPQEEINQLLAKLAKEGQRVVRLKGGDPFIFGRGGEEIETLIQENIDFQVVPGITSANGASSYAGIPLTHRDHAQSVVFATGHLRDETIELNWTALAQPNQTLVFYMGLTGLNIIAKKLVEYGLDDATPVALIENATRENQRVVTGQLSNIDAIAQQEEVKPPALIIIGGVVKLHDTLNWYKQ